MITFDFAKLHLGDNIIADTEFDWATIGLNPAHSLCNLQEIRIYNGAQGRPGPWK